MELNNLQEQYNNLNKEMELFKKTLQEQGYKIENNKVIKLPENLYFLELGFIGETQYEDSGYYKMYRKFIPLDEDILPEVLAISQIESSREREKEARKFIIKLLIEEIDEDIYEKYIGDFNEKLEYINGYAIEEPEEIGFVDVNEHHKELLLEASLKSNYEGWHGYISFIKSNKDLTRFNVDYEFSKFYRENHPWRLK